MCRLSKQVEIKETCIVEIYIFYIEFEHVNMKCLYHQYFIFKVGRDGSLYNDYKYIQFDKTEGKKY